MVKGYKIYIPKFWTEMICMGEAPNHFNMPNISEWMFIPDLFYTTEYF